MYVNEGTVEASRTRVRFPAGPLRVMEEVGYAAFRARNEASSAFVSAGLCHSHYRSVEESGRPRRAHNPKIAGSNPAAASGPFGSWWRRFGAPEEPDIVGLFS